MYKLANSCSAEQCAASRSQLPLTESMSGMHRHASSCRKRNLKACGFRDLWQCFSCLVQCSQIVMSIVGKYLTSCMFPRLDSSLTSVTTLFQISSQSVPGFHQSADAGFGGGAGLLWDSRQAGRQEGGRHHHTRSTRGIRARPCWGTGGAQVRLNVTTAFCLVSSAKFPDLGKHRLDWTFELCPGHPCREAEECPGCLNLLPEDPEACKLLMASDRSFRVSLNLLLFWDCRLGNKSSDSLDQSFIMALL